MPENQHSKSFSAVDPSRRVFITKYAALAFAAPLVASFALDGVASAAPRITMGNQQQFPNQQCPNQFFPNQKFPNQKFPNQQLPNQQLPNQQLPNQQFPNQQFPNQVQIQRDLACEVWHDHGFEGGKHP
jgi:hypothetical protein